MCSVFLYRKLNFAAMNFGCHLEETGRTNTWQGFNYNHSAFFTIWAKENIITGEHFQTIRGALFDLDDHLVFVTSSPGAKATAVNTVMPDSDKSFWQNVKTKATQELYTCEG